MKRFEFLSRNTFDCFDRIAGYIFKKQGIKEGVFNEILADYFAGCVLMPKGWVREKWAEVNNLKQTAEIFQVTELSMWIRLKTMGLI